MDLAGENKMKPSSVTISGSFKAYGFRDGLSSGSEISITFEVPPEMTPLELKKEIVRRKYALDVQTMQMEAARGMVPKEVMDELRIRLKEGLESMIRHYDSTTATAK